MLELGHKRSECMPKDVEIENAKANSIRICAQSVISERFYNSQNENGLEIKSSDFERKTARSAHSFKFSLHQTSSFSYKTDDHFLLTESGKSRFRSKVNTDDRK